MKLKNFILLFNLFFNFLSSFAQNIDFNNYKALKSAGIIPIDFMSSFSEKYLISKNQISVVEDKTVQKSKNEFIVASSFYINELLKSGKVLFGDPVTEYLNDVADELLKNFPYLRKQLRFYSTKSQYLNAFSSDYGIIFINLGLISQLENEAQLAYIMAHEIVHYVNKHSMNLYVKTDNIDKSNASDSKIKYEIEMLRRSFRSKESEFEADKEGLLNYYLKTEYSVKQVNAVFDILLYSYLPFDEVKFDKNFFESSNLKFPSSYFLSDTEPINAESYLYKETETHPSIDVRKVTMFNLIKEQYKKGGKDFIVSESRFHEAQSIARFESLRLKIQEHEFTSALYDCFLLRTCS